MRLKATRECVKSKSEVIYLASISRRVRAQTPEPVAYNEGLVLGNSSDRIGIWEFCDRIWNAVKKKSESTVQTLYFASFLPAHLE